ncbi:uncharacterized protein [Macaca nemestrina]|uniref:uncharacterized protein isoform X4 n=1 Tax=Macaca nemestrina TaxID=9545 RepID=UPI0039B89A8F
MPSHTLTVAQGSTAYEERMGKYAMESRQGKGPQHAAEHPTSISRLPSGRIATMSFDLTSSIPSPVPGTQQRRERAEQDGRIGTAPVSNSQREPHRRPVISAFSTEMKHLGRRVVKCHAGLVQTVSLASGL